MSQSNTNTNNSHNRNFGRGGRGQRAPFGRGGRGQGAPNGNGCSDCRNNCGNKSIAKYSFEGKMKDGPISKLTINETGHRPSQFKKIYNALPVVCADKNYGGLDEVLCTGLEKVENDFMPAYLDANRWSTTHIQDATSNPTACLVKGTKTNERLVRDQTVQQTVVINENLQK